MYRATAGGAGMADTKKLEDGVVTLPEILAEHVRIRSLEEVLKRPLVLDDDAFYNADAYLGAGDDQEKTLVKE